MYGVPDSFCSAFIQGEIGKDDMPDILQESELESAAHDFLVIPEQRKQRFGAESAEDFSCRFGNKRMGQNGDTLKGRFAQHALLKGYCIFDQHAESYAHTVRDGIV